MSISDLVIYEEFMFQITDVEFNRLRSQIVTSNNNLNLTSQIVISNDNLNLKSQFATLEKWDSLRSQNVTIEGRRGQHRKYLPYAFFEQGGCTIPMHTCKGVHKKAIELCIGAGGMHRYCACCTGGAQNNSPEFEGIRNQAGLNSFVLSEKLIAKQAAAQLMQIPWGQNITNNLPDEFKSSLPSIEEIEAELSEGEESQ